jgi:hypothetical protein
MGISEEEKAKMQRVDTAIFMIAVGVLFGSAGYALTTF